VIWTTENEQNYTNFTIERSSDGGVTFNPLGGVPSSALGTYSFLDSAAPIATNSYRLKMEDLNGAISYSKIVTLSYGNANIIAKSNISIYPNPAANVINLTINQKGIDLSGVTSVSQKIQLNPGVVPVSAGATESYQITIVNITGSVIKTATSSSSNWQNNVSSLSPGTYVIQVLKNSDKSLVGKTTFVKL